MGTHTGRSFLNSCLKVPIDPCNNCPAPIYNRPKTFLGRFSKTSKPSSYKSNKPKTPTELENNGTTYNLASSSSSNDICSLAKLYDSIPDYCDINHLAEDEFYTTLDSLRTTCRQLKCKTLLEGSNLSTCSSLSLQFNGTNNTKKSKRTTKKKTTNCTKRVSKQKEERNEQKECKFLEQQPPETFSYNGMFRNDKLLKDTPDVPNFSILDCKRPNCPFENKNHGILKDTSEMAEPNPSCSLIDSRGSKYYSTKENKEADIRHKLLQVPGTANFRRSNTFIERLSTVNKSFKHDLADEVEAFKKSLRDFEEEFKRPKSFSNSLDKTKSVVNIKDSLQPKSTLTSPQPNVKPSNRIFDKVPARSSLCKPIKKSFSFNDIPSISITPEELIKVKPMVSTTKPEYVPFKDPNRMSNYFKTEPRKESKTDTPKIVVNSPSSETVSSKLSSNGSSRIKSRRKKSKNKKSRSEAPVKVPFTILNLTNCNKPDNTSVCMATPLHPVARPNLAATLRAEVSKKKLHELQVNHTQPETISQFDWEVRKTPAWKSLSLNESHKAILSLRLATRKAEQALQQREYELNMELMRQRVKSAPLLLEGTTYWGPNVGKLTHTCQHEGINHECQHHSQSCGKKKSSRHTNNETHRSPSACSRSSNRIETLKNIYASSATKPCSRDSRNCQTINDKHDSCLPNLDHHRTRHSRSAPDSGDDMSSEDRAYL